MGEKCRTREAADLQAGAGKLLVQGAAVSLQGGLNSNASHSESTFRKSGIDTISDLIPGNPSSTLFSHFYPFSGCVTYMNQSLASIFPEIPVV